MQLLALDPATRCGWAVSPPFQEVIRIRVGSHQLPRGASVQEKASALAVWLSQFVEAEQIGCVAIELPKSAPPRRQKVAIETVHGPEIVEKAMGSTQTQNGLWCLHGAIMAVVALKGLPFLVVDEKTWRKDVLGKGNIGAEESKRQCRERLEARDIHVPNADAAEAGGILSWLARQYRMRRAA